ncbi:hypothetical protein GCM10010381_57630 [Streptomyces xantholiticus]|nr:hypothetical protein GCM10010381_57630 [Streptomyces xantholiticus]
MRRMGAGAWISLVATVTVLLIGAWLVWYSEWGPGSEPGRQQDYGADNTSGGGGGG